MITFKIFKHLAKNSFLKYSFAVQKDTSKSTPSDAIKGKENKNVAKEKSPLSKIQLNFEEKKEDENSFELSKTSELTLEKLRKMKTRFSVTKDQYRVDVGIIIDRPPIFLNFSDLEMENIKLRNSLLKKYKMLPPVPKELIEYQLDKNIGVLPSTPENQRTHSYKKEDGSEEYYCEHSKFFGEVDPNVQNPRSIQRAANYKVYLLVRNRESKEWQFPSFHVLESEKFADARNKFFGFLSNNSWKIYYYPVEPYVCQTREFTNEEKLDGRNKKLKGVKIFYFGASHLDGIVEINEKLYDEYTWVSKLEMNQYLTREHYNTFIHSLVLY